MALKSFNAVHLTESLINITIALAGRPRFIFKLKRGSL